MMKQGNLRMREIEADEKATCYLDRHDLRRQRERELAERLQRESREVETDPFDDERSFSTIISRLHKQPSRVGKNGLVRLGR
jgi:hypothetical protein